MYKTRYPLLGEMNYFRMSIKKPSKNIYFHWRQAFILLILFVVGPGEVFPDNLSHKKFCLVPLLKTRVPVTAIKVVKIYPHDTQTFTQGLFFHQNYFYESSGIVGKSFLARKEMLTGRSVQEVKIDGDYFGEGITMLANRIYFLTWRNETLLIYDVRTFREIGRKRYQGEGWGLASDGKCLLMSNGSPVITFRNPDTFEVIRKILVHDDDVPVSGINEMEFVKNEIWANIFMEDLIARISPVDGRVTGWIDVSSLRSYLSGNAAVDVINGIAYDAKADRIFVTGKFWPKIFEIKLLK